MVLLMVVIIATMLPTNAMNAKEIRRLVASAIKPMIGGPNRNPKKEIELTIVSARLGDIILDLPATL